MDVKPPGPCNLKTGNIEAQWTKYRENFRVFLIAKKWTQETSHTKWAIFMGEAGDDVQEIHAAIKESLIKRNLGEDGLTVSISMPLSKLLTTIRRRKRAPLIQESYSTQDSRRMVSHSLIG